MSNIQENLVPIAILSVLIFGENDQELLDQLQELGVLRLTDSKESPKPKEKSSVGQKQSPQLSKGRHLTRAISINVHGKVEVERQFVNGIEKFRVATKTDEPLQLDSLDKETFVLKDKEIRLNFQLRNVRLYDVVNFIIKGTKSLSKDDWAKIIFDLPKNVKLTCRYHIDGMVLGKTIHDSGTAEIKLSGVEITGKVKVSVTEKEINILELNLTYSFDDLVVDKVALVVTGMSKEKMGKLFNETTKKYLKENMDIIAGRLSKEIRLKLNQRLKNISSAKIVNTVKNKGDDDEETEIVEKIVDDGLAGRRKSSE